MMAEIDFNNELATVSEIFAESLYSGWLSGPVLVASKPLGH